MWLKLCVTNVLHFLYLFIVWHYIFYVLLVLFKAYLYAVSGKGFTYLCFVWEICVVMSSYMLSDYASCVYILPTNLKSNIFGYIIWRKKWMVNCCNSLEYVTGDTRTLISQHNVDWPIENSFAGVFYSQK